MPKNPEKCHCVFSTGIYFCPTGKAVLRSQYPHEQSESGPQTIHRGGGNRQV